MKRKIISLEARQLERLEHHSERTGAPQVEIIRRALDSHLDRLDEEEFHLAQYRTSPPPVPNR